MSHFTPRNPTGKSDRAVPADESPFERAARHIEKRTGVPRDKWMGGAGQHPLNARHYRLMARLAGVGNAERRRRAA